MTPHVCKGCTRLYYPTPGPGAKALRCDAIIIGFSDEQIAFAESEGRKRFERHTSLNRTHRFEPRHDPLKQDQDAVGAEHAVSYALGLSWIGGAKPDKSDVGRYGVRWSRMDCMPIRISDAKPWQEMIFVTGAIPVFTLRGWYTVNDARLQREWYRPDPPPYYCVPMHELHDLRRLPELLPRHKAYDIEPVASDDVPD